MHSLFLFHPIYQVITYNEYLPGSLGPDTMSAYNLNLGNPSYDDKLDPQAANEFATAAFRFGHNEVYFNQNDFFYLITIDSLNLYYKFNEKLCINEPALPSTLSTIRIELHRCMPQRSWINSYPNVNSLNVRILWILLQNVEHTKFFEIFNIFSIFHLLNLIFDNFRFHFRQRL